MNAFHGEKVFLDNLNLSNAEDGPSSVEFVMISTRSRDYIIRKEFGCSSSIDIQGEY